MFIRAFMCLGLGIEWLDICAEQRYLFSCRNGFQKLEKIKDSNRQSRQLEELTGKMRECKRYLIF